MDDRDTFALRQILASTSWLERAEEIARSLRRTRAPGGLLLVGTPDDEPWHLAAHLSDESRYAGLPQLAPNLVRWSPPPGAPPHLNIGVERLNEARGGDTLFVVNPDVEAPVPLLERVEDARRTGTTILALDRGDQELASLAHDSMSLPPANAPLTFDGLQHLVSSAAGQEDEPRRPRLRDRVSRFLDLVSGPRGVD